MDKDYPAVILINKRARYEFAILDTVECGIVLNGNEVKAIRNKECEFTDAFIRIKNNQLYMHNFYISAYRHRDHSYAYDGKRVRMLLAHKNEIRKMNRAVMQKKATIIPLDVHLSSHNLIKIAIAVAKGKKSVDKRHDIKLRDIAQDTAREIRQARHDH